MRYDLPLVKYTSREEYYKIANDREIINFENLKNSFPNKFALNFFEYYKTLTDVNINNYKITFENVCNLQSICYISGCLENSALDSFRDSVDNFYSGQGHSKLIFDCKDLRMLSSNIIDEFVNLYCNKKEFTLRNLNYDLKLAFKIAGLSSLIEEGVSFSKFQASSCTVIGEGNNGIIYKVDEETIGKVSKREWNFEDCKALRICLRNAFIAGVPAPLSLGYGEIDGKPAVLMELLNSSSLISILKDGEDHEDLIKDYANLVKSIHNIRNEYKLRLFPRKSFELEILAKAELIDRYLAPNLQGKAKKIIESIDEPEGLLHGDIQPGNIMLGNGKMMFIDFDSFCTGCGTFDLGALYRTLFSSKELFDIRFGFLDISNNLSKYIWDIFIGEYYKGESEDFLHSKLLEIKTIAYVQALAKVLKINSKTNITKLGLARFETFLNEIS